MHDVFQSATIFLTSYLIGAIPFSLWLGRLFIQKDIRKYGDGNPGATNVFRAGSKILGLLVMMLDITKGVIPPLMIQKYLDASSLDLFLSGVAPVLGHAFSPFLKFKGGKALAVTLGTWIGLTTWQVPLIAVISVLAGKLLFDSDGWAVVMALLLMLISVFLWQFPPVYAFILIAQACILIVKHQEFLLRPPHLHLRFNRTGS